MVDPIMNNELSVKEETSREFVECVRGRGVKGNFAYIQNAVDN